MSNQQMPKTLSGKALLIQLYLDCFNLFHDPKTYNGGDTAGTGDWLLKTAEAIKPEIDRIVASLNQNEIAMLDGLLNDDNLTIETDYPQLMI